MQDDVSPSIDDQIAQLQTDIDRQLLIAESIQGYFEATQSSKQQLEQIATIIIGLKIALDGLTKTYED
jgi:hypothetical protein